MDHGAPRSFLDVERGVEVISADGQRVGVLRDVLVDEQTNIFDGLVIDASSGQRGVRFVDAPEVQAIFEQAVVLTLTAAQAQKLPAPSGNHAIGQPGGPAAGQQTGGPLRRAWNRLLGRS
jgi:uncharacterized protein YrrD